MTGRLEQEIIIENKIKKLIQNQPLILNDYYHSLLEVTYGTKLNYINHVVNFIQFMSNKYDIDFNARDTLKEIKVLHINDYLNQFTYKQVKGALIKNTNTYKANILSALKNFFEFLCNNDIIEYNPCSRIKPPKDKRIHDVISLNKEEIQIIQNNIQNGVGSKKAISNQKKWKNRDLAILSLGITTGLRVSAICNINIEDISFSNDTIKVVEKGDVEKEVYVPDNVMELINAWIEDRNVMLDDNSTNALFISNRKKRITANAIRNMLKKYTYNIDKKITPHKLRSTTATNLLEETNDIYLVAEVLGHSNLQNTKRYAKVSNKKKIKAANILGNLVKEA